MTTTSAYKDLLLQASDIDTISLHSGNPGGSGTSNEVTGGGYSRQAAAFNAASGGNKYLTSNINFTTPANQPVTYLGFWSGSTFRGSSLVTGDTTANSSGEYRITTNTRINLADG